MSADPAPFTSMNIALVGCGKMGSALLRGWLTSRVGHVDVLEPGDLPSMLRADALTHHTTAATMTGPWDMVVLAVKPQIMKNVCAALAPRIAADQPVLSIAAGQTMAALQSYFTADQPVIRTMPNTPAAIGQGVTVACAARAIVQHHRSIADQLLRATGLVLWTENETDMDAVTALSGSGPAYVFYLIEMMTNAGIAAGLDADIAAILARQTVIGSATLAATDSHLTAATLRQNVTSPGGTTEAALAVLMDGQVQQIMNEAVMAAAKRSRELSN